MSDKEKIKPCILSYVSIVSIIILIILFISRGGSAGTSNWMENVSGDLTTLMNVGIGTTNPSEKLDLVGNLLVSGNILPGENETYDIGAPGSSFRDLYLSGNTIFLGNTKISTDPITGNIAFRDKNTNKLQTMASDPKDGITWVAREAAEENSWFSVTYGNGLFVAVAPSGTNRVMTSTDGITWVAREAAEQNFWQSVTYGNGLFVAVARSGDNRVMTSTDGITWVAREAAEQNEWRSVTYGNGLFVAVARSGDNLVMTSTDGITWVAREAAEQNVWSSVTYGNGLFVAVSNSGINRGMTSTDGITWVAREAAEQNVWQSVTYGNGLFVAVARSGTNRVMTSIWNNGFQGSVNVDGDMIISRNFFLGNTKISTDPITGNVAFLDRNTNTLRKIVSNPFDGINWTARSDLFSRSWGSVTYGNGLFVAISAQSTNEHVMTSPDGITWNIQTSPEQNSWSSVTYGNGLFVAVSSKPMTSPDGITWTTRAATGSNFWRSVTYGDGLFVAVARSGPNRVMTSTDGINWVARVAAEQNNWRSVTYGDGLFVAVSEGLSIGVADSGTNRVMTSTDGINWVAREAAEQNSWQSVTYGNGLFVAVASSGTNRIMTSPDGITWVTRADIEENSWSSVTYGNGLFVAVATSGDNRTMISTDGITWTAQEAAEQNSWQSVTYGNGLFVAVGNNTAMTYDLRYNTFTGNVGIGVTNPVHRLHVDGNILASGTINPSDSRIKSSISEIHDGEALAKLRLIEPQEYNYIDAKTRGTYRVYGFIAQQVAEHFPEAVIIQRGFVPDVYHLHSIDLENLTIDIPGQAKTGKLRLSTPTRQVDLHVKALNDNVVQFPPNTLSPSDVPTGKVFVFGYQVDDFHTLNKDYLFTVNFAATQEVDRVVQDHHKELSDLKMENTNLKNRLHDIEERYSVLITTLSDKGIL